MGATVSRAGSRARLSYPPPFLLVSPRPSAYDFRSLNGESNAYGAVAGRPHWRVPLDCSRRGGPNRASLSVARAYALSDEAAKVLDVRKVRKEDEAMTTLAFDSYSEGRAHFKELLDAAQSGRPALVRRDGSPSAVVDAERLRILLTDSLAVHPSVVAEAEGWSIFVPGVPVAADGASFD